MNGIRDEARGLPVQAARDSMKMLAMRLFFCTLRLASTIQRQLLINSKQV
jgi:hypothetical protein